MSAELVTLTIDGTEVTVPEGHADHPRRRAGRGRDPAVLRPPVPGAGGRVPPVLRPDRGPAQARDLVHRHRRTGHGGAHAEHERRRCAQAQVANLEFLLLNHPLDCPVCDRGGECPLQDQALAYGPGESRFVEAKRTFPKPIPMSPLIGLDRERCVLCARCTRFCDEISGDRFLELYARGAGERVAIAAGEDLRIAVQRQRRADLPRRRADRDARTGSSARPFDLTSADSVCRHCSAGCAVRVDQRRGEVVRVLARENPEVNDAWICDKGRFAFHHDDAAGRITTPLVRDRGLEPTSFGEALLRGGRRVPRRARRRGGGRPPARRGRLRAVEARADGARHQRRRPPAGDQHRQRIGRARLAATDRSRAVTVSRSRARAP